MLISLTPLIKLWILYFEIGEMINKYQYMYNLYKFQFRVSETNKSYPAKVVQRGAQVDAVSRSIIMIGRTLARHKELIPGMSGIVIIKASKRD